MATNRNRILHLRLRTKCHHTILFAIKLLHAYCFKHHVKAFLLVITFVSLPWIGSIIRKEYMQAYNNNHQGDDDLVAFINASSIEHRRLMLEQKKAEAVKNFENVLLEPPRAASGKSKTYSKKTRYLPDLMEDSLQDYPRLVFIDVNGDANWFIKNYPTRNRKFEIYQVETTLPEPTANDPFKQEDMFVETEMADWLRENVKKGEYVVMKAEADVVEELVNNKVIDLVDELFMECKYQCMKCVTCKRPYWKCLALYGQLKDLGVPVHQWWG
ncbi:hypothetical protein SSX86_008557 [Deinandra increscens subsp. villosa]|uniref:DUF7870 domain-containing protein n=1 Tax=Deinandra increscens subsp. villosa TaxID=3103831 RepID=A0AAP0DFG4_9ASTR